MPNRIWTKIKFDSAATKVQQFSWPRSAGPTSGLVNHGRYPWSKERIQLRKIQIECIFEEILLTSNIVDSKSKLYTSNCYRVYIYNCIYIIVYINIYIRQTMFIPITIYNHIFTHMSSYRYRCRPRCIIVSPNSIHIIHMYIHIIKYHRKVFKIYVHFYLPDLKQPFISPSISPESSRWRGQLVTERKLHGHLGASKQSGLGRTQQNQKVSKAFKSSVHITS